MTQEETKEAIKVMQAFVDGKKIQFKRIKGKNWVNCTENPFWDWFGFTYRITPNQEEPKEKYYCPYTMEEFVKDMVIHGPLIKMEDSVRKQYVLPTCISRKGIKLNEDLVNYETLQIMFYSWQDGTRCRKEVMK